MSKPLTATLPATQGHTHLPPPSGPSWMERLSDLLADLSLPGTLAVLAGSAWALRSERPYLPGSDFGYLLGVCGGSLMLALLLYPLRKRIRFLQWLGPLRHWFRFHLIAGILGPVLILYHSTFRIESINAAVALACMLLVAASGIVGRFIYRRIHNGLFGSRADLKDLQACVEREMAANRPLLAAYPALQEELDRFVTLISSVPAGRLARIWHFLTLGGRRLVCEQRIRRILRQCERSYPGKIALDIQLAPLVGNIANTLRVAQKAAQLSTYERLFSLWHVVHIPFLCLLVITAIVHVIAVHAY